MKRLQYEEIIQAYSEFKKKCNASRKKYKETYEGTKLFVARKGNYKFRDEYVGDLFFHGMEQMFLISPKGNLPILGMIYRGEIKNLLPGIKKEDVYNFLRSALLAAPENQPFRGPLTRNLEFHGINDPPFTNEKFKNFIYYNIPAYERYENFSFPVSISGDEIIGYKQNEGYVNLYVGCWHFSLLLDDFDILRCNKNFKLFYT
jgi:hypothetical protein